jgi:MbtH protein
MAEQEAKDNNLYKVVINDEQQYSIWPAERKNAPGWRDIGLVGPKAECLAHIAEVWTDMRPGTLRMRMKQDRSDG